MIVLDYNTSLRKGKILPNSGEDFDRMREHFSKKVEDIYFLRKQTGNPFIPDTEYAIQPTGYFDFGLYEKIVEFLESREIEFELTENFIKRRDCGFGFQIVSDDLKLKHRDYGKDAVSKALSNGCGTIVCGTGGGKSMMTASLIENIILTKTFNKFKCLIVVPGLSLVDQLVQNFEEYGVSFTFSGWTGKSKLQETDVVICNSENFCARFNDNTWIKKVDVVVVDEVHGAKTGNILTKNINKIKTPHKFGFTGTLPKNKIDEWKIIGTFGPVVFEKNSKELRDEGYLANACIKMIKLVHPNPLKLSYRGELEFLHKNPERFIIIRRIVEKLNKNTLILVNSVEHGLDTWDLLSVLKKKVYFIQGETPVEERMRIIQEMEQRNDVVVIAMSRIFAVGINVKNLHYVMFIAGGKSFIRIVQSIGRGLRLHESKTRLTLLDIYDNMEYSAEHAEKRKLFYEEEQIDYIESSIKLL